MLHDVRGRFALAVAGGLLVAAVTAPLHASAQAAALGVAFIQ
jgi:hypothetical protein